MDMNNVKSIYDNSVGKEVKKIQDGDGNIIWYKVPDGYRKVEYLESNDTQYIDTGWIPQFNDEMYLRVLPMKSSSGIMRPFFGADNFVTARSSSGTDFWKIFNSSAPSQGVLQPDIWLTCKYKDEKYSQSNRVNSRIRGNTPCEMTLYLFARHDTNEKGTCRISLFSVNGKRFMIPVVRITDNKPGMYDIVTDVFYTNQGTGEFTWGEISNG